MFKPPKLRPCDRCSYMPTSTEDMKKHMVSVHGFKQVGAQVFQTRSCRFCNKPALFKVHNDGYCKDHKDLAVDRRSQLNKNYAQKTADIVNRKKDKDYVLLSQTRLHRAKQRHK